MIFPLRRRRTIAATVGGGSGGSGTIAAAITQQGPSPTTGTLRFTGGFPLAPGAVFAADIAARKQQIFVNGIEQAVHVEAMRGAHPDGSLHALRYDFDYTVSSTADVVASVVLGTVRTTTDRTRRTITKSVHDAMRYLLPTAAAYKVTTNLTGMPLAVQSSWTAGEVAFYKSHFDASLATCVSRAYNRGAAEYDPGRAVLSAYCCQDGVSYVKEAITIAYKEFDEYFCPPGIDNMYGGTTQIDTEGLNRYVASFFESHSMMEWTFGAAYIITGWSYYWAVLNHTAQRYSCSHSNSAVETVTGPFLYSIYDGENGPRFCVRGLRWYLTGYRFDCTWGYGDNDYGARAFNYPTELLWWPQALNAQRWSSTNGAYRTNFRGFDYRGVVTGAGVPGENPAFQTSVTAGKMLDHDYNNIANSNFADYMRTNALVVLANTGLLPSAHYYENNGTGTGKYAHSYNTTNTPSNVMVVDGGPTGSTNEINDPFGICMQSRVFAYLAVAYPSESNFGKTWAQWRDIAIDPKQMGGMLYDLKFLGETFNGFDVPYRRQYGNPAGPTAVRTPPVYTTQPS